MCISCLSNNIVSGEACPWLVWALSPLKSSLGKKYFSTMNFEPMCVYGCVYKLQLLQHCCYSNHSLNFRMSDMKLIFYLMPALYRMSTVESQGGCEAAREAWSLCLYPSGEAEAKQEKESQTVWPVQGTDGEGKEGLCTRNKTTSQKKKINFFFTITYCCS